MSSVRYGTAYNMVGLLLVKRTWRLVVPDRNVFGMVARPDSYDGFVACGNNVVGVLSWASHDSVNLAGQV